MLGEFCRSVAMAFQFDVAASSGLSADWSFLPAKINLETIVRSRKTTTLEIGN
jgi:hypothetical protein